MYKIIKSIAPIVLVLYVSSMLIGPCWGEEDKLHLELLDYNDDGSIMTSPIPTERKFKIMVRAYYKDQKLINVKIINADGIKVLDSWTSNNIFDDKSSLTVFALETPKDKGTYTLIFEGQNIDKENVSFQHDIEVTEDYSLFVKALFICLGIVLALALGSIAQRASTGG